MKKILIVFFLSSLLTLPLAAQKGRGNIYGLVVDSEGNPLPGVTITLTGLTIAPITMVSNEEGRFRFLNLEPGENYEVKAELQGFKTSIHKNIVVNAGLNTDLRVVMEVGRLEEEITVVATAPVVQPKKVQVTSTVTMTQIQQLPTARDPWVILQLQPGIQVDRENIGGSESGQQSSWQVRGTTSNEWNMDGVNVTDLSAGASPGYWDVDMFEEISITTGLVDIESRYAGTSINLVTRRGGNRMSLAGRFYLTDEKFQSKLTPQKIAELGVPGYNRIIEIKDYGFNIGGPLLRDKIWWWGSWATQEIKTTVITGVRDDTYLTQTAFKLNFQLLPNNRAEFMVHASKKEKFGRSSSLNFPPGWNQHEKYHFGNPIFKLQDDHMFSDRLFVSAKVGYNPMGWGMWPANDEEITKVLWYNVEKALYENTNTWFFSGRPHLNGVLQAQYFNDDLLGTSHEVKVGFEIDNNETDSVGGYPGNMYINYNYHSLTVDWNGDGKRDYVRDQFGIDLRYVYISRSTIRSVSGNKRYAAYFSDVITWKRLNLNIGLRWDKVDSYIKPRTSRSLYLEDTDLYWYDNYYEIVKNAFTPETAKKIAALLPDNNCPRVERPVKFLSFSPRLGLTYDIFGNGKTIGKLAFAVYPGGALGAGYWAPGGLGGSIRFWWWDKNNDKIIDWSELYWAAYTSARTAYRAFDDNGNFVGNYTREFGLMWSGFEWTKPDKLVDPYYKVDDNWKHSLTYEIFSAVERELMPNFGVSLQFTYRIYTRFSWSLAYYPNLGGYIRNQNDYMVAGTIPATFTDPKTGTVYSTKEAAGRPWYVLKPGPERSATSYSYVTNMSKDRRQVYYGFDLVFNKRLSNRWMLNGSFTYQMQKNYYGKKGYVNPNNLWAYEGKIYGISMGGGSGKVSVPMFSRWLVKLSGLYQLPLGFNVSFTLNGREGAFQGESFTISDTSLPNPQSQSASIECVAYDNRNRLPAVWILNLRLEKSIPFGERGQRIYLSADIFNALNLKTINRKYSISYGTYYVNTGQWTAPSPTSGMPNEIINPLVARFGIRFQF
ncbi:MAG: carboxypeptidase regulatory-like domain-containing protein [Candidatus Aminicenantales bacterium]